MCRVLQISTLLIFMSFNVHSQNDIDEFIKDKDKQQQTILISFIEEFHKEDRILVEEFQDHYEFIVSHASYDGFTGGAEGYKLYKKSGEFEMIWHEHPVPLPKIEDNMENINLARDSVIKVGFKMIKDIINSEMTIDSFDKISVFYNSSSTNVVFTNPIKYIPQNSIYYYDISVDILSGLISYGAISNPENYKKGEDKVSFYKPNEEAEKNIQFVIDAISKSEALGLIDDKKSFIESIDGSLIIYDKQNYFAIERISENQESFYKVDKKTGDISDEAHNELIPPSINEIDTLKEIK